MIDRKAILKELALQNKLTTEIAEMVRGSNEVDLRVKLKDMNLDHETIMAFTGQKIFRLPSPDALPEKEIQRQIDILCSMNNFPTLTLKLVKKEEADTLRYSIEWTNLYIYPVESWMQDTYSYYASMAAAMAIGNPTKFFPLKTLFEHSMIPYGIVGEEFIVVDMSARTINGKTLQ